MTQPFQTLTLPDRTLAYQQRIAAPEKQGTAGVFFLGGFASDMTGTKALFLDDLCAREGWAFTRFDYRGHGASSGRFEEGCIGDWLDDARRVFDGLTSGPQVLVGSSMGGWIGLLLARERPQRMAGFIGVAAAPDFTEDLILPTMTAAQIAAMEESGFFYEQDPPPAGEADMRLPITKKLMVDAKDYLVLRSPLAIPAPVRLIQGQQDVEVPWQTALTLAAHIAQDDTRIMLIKDAGHRLSREADLQALATTVREVMS
ncbi:MAG: alpha/beta hydrolase [Patescibacteria group bacterium]